MRIRLYGRLADAIGPEVEVDTVPGASVAELRSLLASTYPQAAEVLGRSRALLADFIVGDDRTVDGFDRLEFLPPVSGG